MKVPTNQKETTMNTNTNLTNTDNANGGGLPFAIEHNVPLATLKKPNPFDSLFSKMKANDSFLIGKDKDQMSKVHYYATKWAIANNAKFAFRNTAEGKRCWRLV